MRFITIILSTALMLLSCSSETVVIKYYLLEKHSLPGESSVESEDQSISSLPYKAEILQFKTSIPYDQNRIALRSKSNELNYFYYHNWAELPSTAVTYFIWNKIKEAELFQAFNWNLYNMQADYLVSGTIDQIERVNIDSRSSAHLKMSIELVEKRTNKVLITHSFDRYEPIRKSAPMNVFAQEINKILNQEADMFMKKIYIQLNPSDH